MRVVLVVEVVLQWIKNELSCQVIFVEVVINKNARRRFVPWFLW